MSTDGPRGVTVKASVDDVLTVEEFCSELKVSKDTFYHWRKVGTAPVCHRLPNGELRISRTDRDAWLAQLRDAARTASPTGLSPTTCGSGRSRGLRVPRGHLPCPPDVRRPPAG